jgi:anti-sigma regulatory factor (Ser/Thr protein kinase)
MAGPGWSRVFVGRDGEVPVAREFAAAVMTAWGFPELAVQVARLVVSELAANAVEHTASGARWGQFTVSLFPIGGANCVRVAVTDDGGPGVPRRVEGAEERSKGWGLILVSELAADWGVAGDEHSRTVWADVDEACRPVPWASFFATCQASQAQSD